MSSVQLQDFLPCPEKGDWAGEELGPMRYHIREWRIVDEICDKNCGCQSEKSSLTIIRQVSYLINAKNLQE